MDPQHLFVLVLGQAAEMIEIDIVLSHTFTELFQELKRQSLLLTNVVQVQAIFHVYDPPIPLPADQSYGNFLKIVDGKTFKTVNRSDQLRAFLPASPERNIHIILRLPLPQLVVLETASDSALGRIRKRIDPRFIAIKLQALNKYQETDLGPNDVTITHEIDDHDHFISKLRVALRRPRLVHVTRDLARTKLFKLLKESVVDRLLFNQTFQETKIDLATNCTDGELRAFSAVGSYMDWAAVVSKRSSASKDACFSYLVAPPLRKMEKRLRSTKFDKSVQWLFPLLIEVDGAPIRRKYLPHSDFSLVNPSFSPYVIGEVISEKSESDRYRMLLQGAAAVRLGNFLRRSKNEEKPFVLLAIYLTGDLIAERYLMYQDDATSPYVQAVCDTFDVKILRDAVGFMKELYNYEEAVKRQSQNWNEEEASLSGYLKESVKDLQSLSTKRRFDGSQRGQAHQPTLAPTREVDSSAEETVDGLYGVYERHEFQSILNSAGIELLIVSDERPHVAAVKWRGKGNQVFILKYIKAADVSEVNVLRYLGNLTSDSNRAIPLLHEFQVSSGIIAVMPSYPMLLSDLVDLEAGVAFSLTQQFLDGVAFLHEHRVAHLDLKPSNVVVNLSNQQLRIIDFGLSIQFTNGDDTEWIDYFAGTLGWTAPEVGIPDGRPRRFSATRADVWASGKVVNDICTRCMRSPLLAPLHIIAQKLLVEDPQARPTIKDVVATNISSSASPLTHPAKAMIRLEEGRLIRVA